MFSASNIKADVGFTGGPKDFGGPPSIGGGGAPTGRNFAGTTPGNFADPESGSGLPSSPANIPLPTTLSDFGTSGGTESPLSSLSRGAISQPSNPGIDQSFRVPSADIEKITEDTLMKPDPTASSATSGKGLLVLGGIAALILIVQFLFKGKA